MIKPTIHLNGSPRGHLLDTYGDALQAIREAHDKLISAYPNGRDYYPQGSIVIYTAVDEHLERVKKLKSIQSDLEQLIEHILDLEA